MTYTVERNQTERHNRAYVLPTLRHAGDAQHAPGDPVAVFITPAGNVTSARKAAMMRVALTAIGKDAAAQHATDAELSAQYDRTPWCRWDSVTVTHITLRNNDDASDFRMAWDYSHSLGGGELPFNTIMATV